MDYVQTSVLVKTETMTVYRVVQTPSNHSLDCWRRPRDVEGIELLFGHITYCKVVALPPMEPKRHSVQYLFNSNNVASLRSVCTISL